MNEQAAEPSQEAEAFLQAEHEAFIERRSLVVRRAVEDSVFRAADAMRRELNKARQQLFQDGYSLSETELRALAEETLREHPGLFADPLKFLQRDRHLLNYEFHSVFEWLEQAIATGIVGQLGYDALKKSLTAHWVLTRLKYRSRCFPFNGSTGQASLEAATYLTAVVFKAIIDQCYRHELPLPSTQALRIIEWKQTETGCEVRVENKDDDSFAGMVLLPSGLKSNTEIRVVIRSAAGEQAIKSQHRDQIKATHAEILRHNSELRKFYMYLVEKDPDGVDPMIKVLLDETHDAE